MSRGSNRGIHDEIRQSLNWLMVLGVLMMLLGIAAIAEPFIATIIIARILSWIFLFVGVIRLVHAIESRRQRGFWLMLLVAVLYLVVGILLVGNVLGAKLTLSFVFGGAILAQGILEVIAAFQVRPEPNWGWMLFSAIIAIVLGILILYRWPFNARWLLGFFSGISFLFTGVWMIMLPQSISDHLSRN
jgi:uncharacterized membrane protein HdeD (DUF308 family)